MHFFYGILFKSIIFTPVIAVFLIFRRKMAEKISAVARCRIWIVMLVALMLPAGAFELDIPEYVVEKTPGLSLFLSGTDKENENHIIYMDTGSIVYKDVSPAMAEAEVNYNTAVVVWIWLSGSLVFAMFTLYTVIRFKCKKLILRKTTFNNITYYLSQQVTGPIIVGIFRYKIILPEIEYSDEQLDVILRHEQIHAKHFDILKKIFALAVNVIIWFNPAIWLVRKQLCRDIEFACDERITQNMGEQERIAYGELLLFSAKKNKNAIIASYFSEKKYLKERIESIVIKKKLKKGIPLLTVVLVLAFVCSVSLSNVSASPEDEEKVEKESIIETENTESETEKNITAEKEESTETAVWEPVTRPYDEGETESEGRLCWPLSAEFNVITGTFGTKYGEDGQVIAHNGIDITSQSLEVIDDGKMPEIYAALSGKVVEADYNEEDGYYVAIDGGNGYVVRYLHCMGLNVAVGDTVNQGETVAFFGCSGDVTGACLHVELLINGEYVNPEDYFM